MGTGERDVITHRYVPCGLGSTLTLLDTCLVAWLVSRSNIGRYLGAVICADRMRAVADVMMRYLTSGKGGASRA